MLTIGVSVEAYVLVDVKSFGRSGNLGIYIVRVIYLVISSSFI